MLILGAWSVIASSASPSHVIGPLERDGFVGMCSWIERDGRCERLEVHEVARKPCPAERLAYRRIDHTAAATQGFERAALEHGQAVKVERQLVQRGNPRAVDPLA